MKFWSKLKHSHWRKYVGKCRLRHFVHFVLASMCGMMRHLEYESGLSKYANDDILQLILENIFVNIIYHDNYLACKMDIANLKQRSWQLDFIQYALIMFSYNLKATSDVSQTTTHGLHYFHMNARCLWLTAHLSSRPHIRNIHIQIHKYNNHQFQWNTQGHSLLTEGTWTFLILGHG